MPYFNPLTNREEETPAEIEERKKREEQNKPGFFDNLGTALQTAGSNFLTNVQNAPENFVNNIKQGFENVQNAPQNFVNNVQNIPQNVANNVQNIPQNMVRPMPVRPVSPQDYSLANQQGGPGLRYGQAFAPQEQPVPQAPVGPVAPAMAQPNMMPQQGQQNNPNETFNRMIQAESNGRQTNAQGQVLTSNKGAMGIAQIMPTTAMQPGYGVPTIFDLAQQRGIPFQNRDIATAQQLLGNKELNQQFGQNYYNAMQNRFPGQGGIAAYNAGPGRVQQNVAQNQGQLNVTQLPQETQGYLQRVNMPNQTAVPINPAQVAQQPVQQPIQQQIQPPQPVVEQLTPVQLGINAYQTAQNDINNLMKLNADESLPEFIRTRAGDRAMELYDNKKKINQANEEFKDLGPKEIADVAQGRSKSSVGDWLQYLLFKHVGLNDLANEKGDQLGIGHQWQSAIGPNGENFLIKTSASGRPIEGYDAATTNALTQQQLMQAMTNIGGKNKPDVSLQDVEATVNGKKIKGRVVTTFNAQNQPVTRVESGGKYYNYTGDWQPVSISTAAAKSETNLVNSLRKTFGNDVLKAEAQMIQDAGNFGSQTNPMTREQFRALYMAGSTAPAVPASSVSNVAQPQVAQPQVAQPQVAQPAQNVPQMAPQPQVAQPQPAQAQLQQAPVRQAGEPVTAFKERLKDWNQQQELIRSGQKETLKKASDVIGDSANIVTSLTNIESAANDALNKQNNFGTIINGILPFEQTIGQTFKTQDHINTMNVLEQVNKVAAQNAKMLGTNPTDRDLQFVTSTKPDITWSKEAVADWLRKSAEGTRRTLDFARKQVESGGTYIPATPQSSVQKTPQQLAQEELERRKGNK
jgi:Transglycosylase SLT domain